MARVLYELAGAEEDRRFSPYCWRIRMALAHKGLDVETRPWRFAEKANIAFSGQDRVPVLIDGGRAIADSWAIANYLEDSYPDAPPLFGSDDARKLARFVNCWADGVLQPALLKTLISDIFDHVHEGDRAYFRESREARFGKTIESFKNERERWFSEFRTVLIPLRAMLAAQPYFGGDHQSYADYIVFGAFQFARCISPFPLLAADDPISLWRARLFESFDHLAARAKGYTVPGIPS